MFYARRMALFPIIEKLGGRKAVFEQFRASGDGRTTIDAIRMWHQRSAIPGDAIVLLMQIAEREGIAYEADDFVAERAAA